MRPKILFPKLRLAELDSEPAPAPAAPPVSSATSAAAATSAHPAALSSDSALKGFYPYCATCHQSSEAFPPNFLSGADDEVISRLRQCAPRLFVRLSMPDLVPAQREKTPMPPESLLPAFGTDAERWRTSPVRAALLAQVSGWLRAENGLAPNLSQLLAGGYEALRPCLPNRDTAAHSLPR